MKHLHNLAIALLSVAAFAVVGCGKGTEMTQDEINKKTPPMSDADRAKVMQGMAAGAAKANKQESDWAKSKSPEELARINAERAKMGRPPLGGG